VRFILIEEDSKRAEALAGEVKNLGKLPLWAKTSLGVGTFAGAIAPLLDAIEAQGKQLAPTFAFIDPFGFSGVPLELVRRIAKFPRCECFVSFMFESVNRFLGHPAPKIQGHFDELFGTRAWRSLAKITDPRQRRDAILDLYVKQLRDYAGFKYVRTFEMIDAGNKTEYFLCFGTNSLKGLSVMKQAMWKADPVGGQRFSDRDTSGQLTLLSADPDLAALQKALQKQFRGKGWVRIEEITEFVLIGTPYSEAIHLKRRTLALMEKAAPPKIEVRRPPGARKMAGAYKEGTQIRFL
jgi:three-Cys-motif partner protein